MITEKICNKVADYLENNQGYSLFDERDKNGFWVEEYVSEHKWKDIFEMMQDYADWELKRKVKSLGKITSKYGHEFYENIEVIFLLDELLKNE